MRILLVRISASTLKAERLRQAAIATATMRDPFTHRFINGSGRSHLAGTSHRQCMKGRRTVAAMIDAGDARKSHQMSDVPNQAVRSSIPAQRASHQTGGERRASWWLMVSSPACRRAAAAVAGVCRKDPWLPCEEVRQCLDRPVCIGQSANDLRSVSLSSFTEMQYAVEDFRCHDPGRLCLALRPTAALIISETPRQVEACVYSSLFCCLTCIAGLLSRTTHAVHVREALTAVKPTVTS